MDWEDQRRQEHGWFGSGTGPNDPEGSHSDDAAAAPQTLHQRRTAVISAAVAAVPRGLPTQAATLLNPGTSERLNAVMAARSGNRTSNRAQFTARFFGRDAGDPVVTALLLHLRLTRALVDRHVQSCPSVVPDRAAFHVGGIGRKFGFGLP